MEDMEDMMDDIVGRKAWRAGMEDMEDMEDMMDDIVDKEALRAGMEDIESPGSHLCSDLAGVGVPEGHEAGPGGLGELLT